MATRPSVLAWEIPWTEEPGGLWSMGLQSPTRLNRLSTHWGKDQADSLPIIKGSGCLNFVSFPITQTTALQVPPSPLLIALCLET